MKKLATWKTLRTITPYLLLIAILAIAIAHMRYIDCINDDAFISFRYAHNLVHHGELTYNLGERVEGYTNFLWTMMMAGVLWLGGDPVPWSNGLGLFFALGTIVFVFFFASWFQRKKGAPKHTSLWPLFAPFLLASSSTYATWAQGGLETSLFTALLTVGLLLFWAEWSKSLRRPLSAVFIALAAFTRPEGLFVFVLLGALYLADLLISRAGKSDWKRAIVWAGIFLAIYMPYWLWRYSYYGYIFPNTYYVKAGVPLWTFGRAYVLRFLVDSYAWVLPLLFLLPWYRASHHKRLGLLVLAAVVPYIFHVCRVGGDFMENYRYLNPILPFLYVAIQTALATTAGLLTRDREETSTVWSKLTRIAATATSILVLVTFVGYHNWDISQKILHERDNIAGINVIGWLKKFVDRGEAIGTYLEQTMPPGTTIATTAAGAIPYYSKLPTLDILGLNDLEIAHSIDIKQSVSPTKQRPGHTIWASDEFIFQRNPDIIIQHPRVGARPFGPNPVKAQQMARHGYVHKVVPVPNMQPRYWGFFIKRELAETLGL